MAGKKCRKCKEPMGMAETFNGTKLWYQCLNRDCPRYGVPEYLPTPKAQQSKLEGK